MSNTTPMQTALAQAFRRFERAAVGLEQRQSALQDEVDRLERKLGDTNRELEAVLDALDEGIAVVSADGRLQRTNRAFDRMELIDAEGAMQHDAIAELVEAAHPGGTARLRAGDVGDLRDLAATVTPVGGTDGTRVLMVQDVTEIRREEQEGGRRRRLEALGRMAAEIAHEVRNPLGSIRLFAGMLQDDLEDQEEQRAMIDQILSATSGLEGTVSNLLVFASPAQSSRKRTDLVGLASEVCSLLAPSCSVRGVRLEVSSTSDDCPIDGDPEGLRQLLLNLLGNALDATGDGGRVHVAVSPGVEHVTLEVEDNGRGIEPEDLPRVFDPFFTRTQGGTGLGLSIVHRTVERHGGRISLDSEPGKGTRVRIELPASPFAVNEECHG